LAELYKNVKELKNASDIIIEGRVKKTENIIRDGLPFTVSEIEIYKIFKSNNETLKKGDIIHIIENGGIIDKETLIKSFKEKFPNKEIDEDKVKPVKETNDGIPQMTNGEHVIIFGAETYGIIEEPSYFVLGVYQGKFTVDGEKIKHQVPKDVETKFENKITIKNDLVDKIKDK